MNIAFVDLRAQHDELRAEIDAALWGVIDESAFVGGRYVEEFEKAFAAFCKARECVGVGSGTDALRIALQVVGVQSGDVVVTVAHTFIATVEAITQLGARPVFVDIDPGSYTLAPTALESFLATHCAADRNGQLRHTATGAPVRAVIPVHLYGQPADMEPIVALARSHGLKVVEDAAQAHGAAYGAPERGRRLCGTLGDAAAFSFYPGKNLGAMGEAGAVVTNDPEAAALARVLRDHGQSARYTHVRPDGSNARLDGLQAAVLSVKLQRLAAWNERRRLAAGWYREALAGADVTLPVELPYAYHIYHLYVIQCANRNEVAETLRSAGIGVGFHYPTPLHRQQAYASLCVPDGALPVTEAAAASIVSLPMHPHLSLDAVHGVAERVGRVARR